MKFQSTRANDTQLYTFESALFHGWALDGGMLMPTSIPIISTSTLQLWSHLTFSQLLIQILSLYIDTDEIPIHQLQAIVMRAMSRFQRRENGIDIPDSSIIHLQRIATHSSTSPDIHVCELWHGPTLAFKDIPLQVVGQMLQYFLEQRKRHINIVVGTSGDTGSAALECIRGSPYASIFVLYPHQRISPIQTLQMTTVVDENCHVIACDGSSDDLDIPIKSLFDDAKFAQENALCSINSVNICRILVQIAHFYYTYLRIYPRADGQVSFSLPTGAGGHLTAGIMAKLMGLPIHKICISTNTNDILKTFINHGTYVPTKDVTITYAPAMDIAAPYNIERVVWMMMIQNKDRANIVRSYMSSITSGQGFTLSSSDHHIITHTFGLISVRVTDDEILTQIRVTKNNCDYLIDPHTAVGVHSAFHAPTLSSSPSIPILCFSTAHPAKFLDVCSRALSWTHDELMSHIQHHAHATSVFRVSELHEKKSRSILFAKNNNWESQLRTLIANETTKKHSSQSLPSSL